MLGSVYNKLGSWRPPGPAQGLGAETWRRIISRALTEVPGQGWETDYYTESTLPSRFQGRKLSLSRVWETGKQAQVEDVTVGPQREGESTAWSHGFEPCRLGEIWRYEGGGGRELVTQAGDPVTEQSQVSSYRQAGANGQLEAKVKSTGLTAGGGEGQLSQAGWGKFQRLHSIKCPSTQCSCWTTLQGGLFVPITTRLGR